MAVSIQRLIHDGDIIVIGASTGGLEAPRDNGQREARETWSIDGEETQKG
jgi:hypothetical protein